MEALVRAGEVLRAAGLGEFCGVADPTRQRQRGFEVVTMCGFAEGHSGPHDWEEDQ